MEKLVAVIENGEACVSIGLAMRILRQAIGDLEWRDDLKEAHELFTKGIHGIRVVPVRRGTSL